MQKEVYKKLKARERPEAVRVLVKHELVRGRIYILDATDLPTTKRFRGCGVKKGVKKVWGRGGQEVEVAEYVYGYKLLFAGGEAQAGGGGAEELFYLMDMTPKEIYRLKIKRFRREIE